MPPKFEIEKLVDSLATTSDIIFLRLFCQICKQCEPCEPISMKALTAVGPERGC
jgi:hypothetical protein